MCLGIPLKIIKINNNEAVAEANGIKKDIRLDFMPDAEVGDYVMVHAGFALDKIDMTTAEETIDALNEIEKIMHEGEKSE